MWACNGGIRPVFGIIGTLVSRRAPDVLWLISSKSGGEHESIRIIDNDLSVRDNRLHSRCEVQRSKQNGQTETQPLPRRQASIYTPNLPRAAALSPKHWQDHLASVPYDFRAKKATSATSNASRRG